MLTNVEILTPLTPRAWHVAVRDLLRAQGRMCWLRPVPAPQSVRGLDLLQHLEQRLYRVQGGGESRQVPRPHDSPPSICDLRIDLSGRAEEVGDVSCLVPLADHAPGESAMLAALLDGRAPELSVVLHAGGAFQPMVAGLPALEEPHQIVRSLDRCCARMVDLVVAAVRIMEGAPLPDARWQLRPTPRPGLRSIGRALLQQIGGRVRDRVRRLGGREPAWRVAWRRAPDGTRLSDTFGWPAASYQVLPDDGARYYADPFLFARDGRTWLFVEEFPYATGKGILSVLEMGPQGPLGTPVPFLEEACHLSYPQVFDHEGVVYMIPETSGRGTIELWRCTGLPDRWELVAILAEGVTAADATLLRHEGRWWIFAALSDSGQSSWDMLGLFMADRLEGPWRPHPANPVLIDARAARPAGRFMERDGALWRPVQDCSQGYGSALGFARVTLLTPDAYRQTPGPVLTCPPAWRSRGVHTLDAAAGLEVIDVLAGPAERLAPA